MTTLEELAREAASCTRCDLYQRATATVFGEGRPNSRLALVGEQPGDQEDKQGHPFVGPAGHVLDRALRDSGINRDDAYVTNAVKHFKWEARGQLEDATVGDWHGPVLSTVHPSSILRAQDDNARQEAFTGFVADLVKAREALAA